MEREKKPLFVVVVTGYRCCFLICLQRKPNAAPSTRLQSKFESLRNTLLLKQGVLAFDFWV